MVVFIMLLDLCDKNFFTDLKNINIICYIIVLLCCLLCFCLIYQNKHENKVIKKIMILISIFSIIGFGFLITIIINKNINYDGCYCKFYNLNLKPIEKNTIHTSLENITFNSVIVVGDSRMWLIEKNEDKLNIPINFSFVAKSGAKIDWLEKEALSQVASKLDKADDNYTYHVVMNMGVNDLNDNISVIKRANEYFDLYKKIALKYPNVKFYLLSVNPIDEIIINEKWAGNYRTNRKINMFNNEMNKLILDSRLGNMYNCDSYHSISFKLPDGLHYSLDTDQNILNFISNKCILYN